MQETSHSGHSKNYENKPYEMVSHGISSKNYESKKYPSSKIMPNNSQGIIFVRISYQRE